MNLNYEGLLEPQKEHSVKLLNSLHLNGVAFDSSQTGTGKTYCAAWIAKNFNSPVVVIGPKVVMKTWKTVLGEFGIKAEVVINYEKLTRGNTPYYKYVDSEYNKAKYWWESKGIVINFPKNSLVIVDECHKCKGLNSLNGELLAALKTYGYNVLVLSATAATNVTEMKSFGYLTNLHGGSDFKNFCVKNGVNYNRFGAMVWDSALTQCQTGLRDIHNTLYNITNIASRMTRDMFGSIFPQNRVSADAFDIGSNTDKLNKVYEVMEAELAQLDERSKSYKEHHFAIMMKARRMSELLKVPTMVEWIEDMFDEGISPVVFINFQDTLEAIEKRLSKSKKFNGMIAKVVGGQSDKSRNADVEAFQADNKRIMLVNLAAGNAGLSLHDLNGNFPRMSLINPSWSAFHLIQALGRIHRAEGKTPCVQKLFFAAGTIEERQRQRVDVKVKNIDLLNDGDLSFEINLY